jgi:serine/threonine protein phosphatase 1
MSQQSDIKQALMPPDTRVYAIGDVHGRADLLAELHKRILEDANDAAEARRVLVYLGDYIDRGPDSAGVVEKLIESPLPDFEQVFLMGNHEEFLLHFLDNPGDGETWLANGGDSTLTSYGVEPGDGGFVANLMEVCEQLRERMPAAHLEFYEHLNVAYQEGDYLFVHAGIRPGVPLADQTEEDLLWIREPFLDANEEHEVVVVHGHTPVKEAQVHDNRIAVDTGAVWSDRLTAVVLHDDEHGFLHT